MKTTKVGDMSVRDTVRVDTSFAEVVGACKSIVVEGKAVANHLHRLHQPKRIPRVGSGLEERGKAKDMPSRQTFLLSAKSPVSNCL